LTELGSARCCASLRNATAMKPCGAGCRCGDTMVTGMNNFCQLLLPFALLAVLASGCAQERSAPPAPTAEIRFVPEMQAFRELDDWQRCEPDAHGAEAESVRRAWKVFAPRVEEQVTPRRVRELSGWAKKEMETYRSVPPFAAVPLKPVAADREQGKVLFEGTADTLPSHHPTIVTRWLKVFLVYDRRADEIERAIVTIRGQILE